MNEQIDWQTSKTLIEYLEALEIMESRVAEIQNGNAPELIWFLEHPSLYTMGTSAKESDVYKNDRCPVYKTGRGGQVTYHGPGQRVVYIMLDLKRRNPDIRAYVKALESWVISSLKEHQITSYRREGRVGLWVPRNSETDDKIAAIGVRLKKWVTLHGLCINVNPDLSFYNDILPCGIREHGVTSMHALGKGCELSVLDKTLKRTFSQFF